MADDSATTFGAGAEPACPAYSAQFSAIAEKLYAFGATPSDIAEAFGVSQEEISHWERDHVEFYDACERGRAAVTREIEAALHKRATGYVESGERLMKVEGELVRARYRRQMPPSVAAIGLLLARGKTARDLSGDHFRDLFKGLTPRTVLDIAEENEKKWNSGIGGDE